MSGLGGSSVVLTVLADMRSWQSDQRYARAAAKRMVLVVGVGWRPWQFDQRYAGAVVLDKRGWFWPDPVTFGGLWWCSSCDKA